MSATIASSGSEPIAATAQPTRIPLMVAIPVACYFLFTPYLFMPNGMPQIADLFMLATMAILSFTYGIVVNKQAMMTMRLLLVWIGYVVCISLVQTIYNSNPDMALTVAFYSYNGIIFTCFMMLYSIYGRPMLKLIGASTAWTIFSQVALALAMFGNATARGQLFFNNPNQLGYFVVLCSVIYTICARVSDYKSLFSVAFFFGAILLCLVSLSRAAGASLIILLVLLFWKKPGTLLSIVLIVVGVMLSTNMIEKIQVGLAARVLQGTDESDIEDRGYDRIAAYPYHLVFGAAERGYYRFPSIINTQRLLAGKDLGPSAGASAQTGGGEIHSSYGTLLFCYGFVGSFIFLLLVASIVRGATFEQYMYMSPIALYGITHQGIRESLFWVVLALFLCMVIETKKDKQRAEAATLAGEIAPA